MREILSHQRLLHAHVVQFKCCFSAPPFCCIVLEYVPGKRRSRARRLAHGRLHPPRPGTATPCQAASGQRALAPARLLQMATSSSTSTSTREACGRTRRGGSSSS